MIIEQANENFIFTKRIEFEDLHGNTEFVELREMNTSEKSQMLRAGKVDKDLNPTDLLAMMEHAEKIFPQCLVDSSFEHSDGRKAKPDEVYSVLKKRPSVMYEILHNWMGQGDGETPFGLAGDKDKN